MASRYHRLPSSLLRLTVEEWSLNMLAAFAGQEAEIEAQKKAQREAEQAARRRRR